MDESDDTCQYLINSNGCIGVCRNQTNCAYQKKIEYANTVYCRKELMKRKTIEQRKAPNKLEDNISQ
jgi:hypothetical protein